MLYFSSDHHFYHSNIIEYCNRPFKSIEEMNETLIANWNEVVKPDDEIYYLGDFSLAMRPVELFTKRLNGKKYLVPGNHDRCHSFNHKKEEKKAEWVKKYEDLGWDVLPEQLVLVTDPIYTGTTHTFALCHHPYRHGDAREDIFEKWLPKDEGNWLLCGHVHQKWKKLDNMINVGVDVWDYKPVSINEILKEIAKV